jgi:Tfp pilus assembly protein FimT
MNASPLPSSHRHAIVRARASARRRGSVLLEYLIVLAILGVMAALALDERTTALKRAYTTRGQELMRPVP